MTNRVLLTAILLSNGAVFLACGSSSDSGSQPPGACSGATPVSLTVKNYLAWCNVSVNGGAASAAASQTVCVPQGSVPVTAQPLTGFELGTNPWHHTTGDTGSGEMGTVTGTTSAATVATSGSSGCAWVCCETSGLHDCPTTDQCP